MRTKINKTSSLRVFSLVAQWALGENTEKLWNSPHDLLLPLSLISLLVVNDSRGKKAGKPETFGLEVDATYGHTMQTLTKKKRARATMIRQAVLESRIGFRSGFFASTTARRFLLLLLPHSLFCFIYGNILLLAYLFSFFFQFMQINSKRQRGGVCCWGSGGCETTLAEDDLRHEINSRFIGAKLLLVLKAFRGECRHAVGLWGCSSETWAIYTFKLNFLPSPNNSALCSLRFFLFRQSNTHLHIRLCSHGNSRVLLACGNASKASAFEHVREFIILKKHRLVSSLDASGEIIEHESALERRIQKVSLLLWMVLCSRFESPDTSKQRKKREGMSNNGGFLSETTTSGDFFLVSAIGIIKGLVQRTKDFKVDDCEDDWNEIQYEIHLFAELEVKSCGLEVKLILFSLFSSCCERNF